MKTSTRLLFKTLLRRFDADCVCDIGACDGYESLVFREVLPNAVILTFEANPLNFKKIASDPRFPANRIAIYPYAITDSNGAAPFHVPDEDYDHPDVANLGLGSLLPLAVTKVRETVQVQTRRIDEFVLSDYPNARRIGLWIDAEGAEYGIVQGMAGIQDRVVALHVEVAFSPVHPGQKLFPEVERLLKTYGFMPICTSKSPDGVWGDVVFVPENRFAELGWRFHSYLWMGRLVQLCRVDSLGSFLKKHCYPVYRILFRLYVKLFT